MILLNLFTAVVLENFQVQEEQAEWTLTPAALEVPSSPLFPLRLLFCLSCGNNACLAPSSWFVPVNFTC